MEFITKGCAGDIMQNQEISWRAEEDALLAEIALKHIREGSYELKAFAEASDAVGHNVSECSYRWNCIVREQYEEAMEEAKLVRKLLLDNRKIVYFPTSRIVH